METLCPRKKYKKIYYAIKTINHIASSSRIKNVLKYFGKILLKIGSSLISKGEYIFLSWIGILKFPDCITNK